MFENAVVTNVGKALIAQYIQGATLNFASAKAGEGTVAAAALMAQTALVTEKQTLSIVGQAAVTGGIKLTLQVTSQGLTTGYTLNQYGVFANTGGSNILLCIVQDDTGFPVPSFSTNPDYVVTLDLTILMDNTGSFTVTLDTSAVVAQSTFNAGMANKVDKTSQADKIYGTDANGNQVVFNKADLQGNSFPLLTSMFFDHQLNDASWLRGDTFSWHNGVTYSNAYQELLSEYNNASSVEEIEGSITFKRTPKGYKIALATQETAILNKYNSSGIAWYYILDTANTQFKLPRTKFGFEGLRGSVGDDIAESLPNITGTENIVSGSSDGCFSVNVSGDFMDSGAAGGVGQYGTSTFNAHNSNATYQDYAPVQERATQMYLYFYVGKYTQSATQQTAGLNSELFNGKMDRDMSNMTANIRFVQAVSSKSLLPSWYRIYNDGWCEQGGVITLARTPSSFSLLKKYEDNNYGLQITYRAYEIGGVGTFASPVDGEKFNASYLWNTNIGNRTATWEARGYLAEGEY